jgi:hypothetical protein
VVLMGNRCPKEGHDAVTHDLIHGPFVAVHGCYQALQHGIEECAGVLGVAVGQQLQRAFQVGEQHGDVLALAFQGTPRGQDLLDQMARGITNRWLETWRAWRGSLPAERRAAFATELRSGRIVSPTPEAVGPQGTATLDAELTAVEILRLAVWAAHGGSPWRTVSAAEVNPARNPTCVPGR